MAVQFTDRDIALLAWIHGHGFVEIRHIQKKFFQSLDTAYTRVRQLVKAKVLLYERLLHNQPGIYRLSHLGHKLLGDPLPLLKQVRLGQYRHDLLLVDMELHLLGKYPGTFIPERRLRQQKGLSAFASQGHVCDGVLEWSGKSIALEVELSSKSRQRRQEIIRWYTRHFDYQEVWYFVGHDRVKRELARSLSQDPDLDFIQVFDLNEISSHVDVT